MPTPRGIPLAPLTGPLDLRSSPDLLGPGALRMRQNFQTIAENRLRRGTGWTKFLSSATYNNEDYHDQLLALTAGGIRQPVTLLFESETTQKTRSLIVGKQGAIAQLDEWSGNYRILGSGYGGVLSTSAAARRFKAAQLGDYLIVTNDWDKPMYHVIEAPSIDSEPLLQPIPDLDTIALTRAKVVWSWQHCVFFADVEMDGERFAYRILWSGFNDPLSFDPVRKLRSITGRRDLYTDERILAFKPFGDVGLIYTSKRIWVIQSVGGEISFGFAVRYDSSDNEGKGILKYPNTLVRLAQEHAYLGEDGLYTMTPQQTEPARAEWLHKSTPWILDNIDSINCEAHVAIASGSELLISTASASALNACPDRSLLVNVEYQSASCMDAGFTALCNHRSYKVPTIIDFIISNGICDLAGLADLDIGFETEGLPKPLPIETGAFTPDCIYTTVTQEIDLGDGGDPLVTEDWTEEEASATSLCALLGDMTLDDFCRSCEGVTLLVGAASSDLCLKQLGNVFYRERCANPTSVGVTGDLGYDSALGAYILDGLTSVLRFAPVFMPKELIGQPLVRLTQFILDAISKVQNPPSTVLLRVGISAQVADPNVDQGRIVWFTHSAKQLKWLTDRTDAQHRTAGTVPSTLERWNLMRQGRVLYIELSIPGVGGDCELSAVVGEVEAVAAKNY